MNFDKEISAIILAGGKSTRMGTDKALLKYNDKTFLEIVTNEIKKICKTILICSNNLNHKIDNCELIFDKYSEIGPIGGIYSGLSESKTEYNIVIACDNIFIKAEIFELLWEKSKEKNYDITIANYKNFPEPLIGIYNKSALKFIQQNIINKDYKLQNLLKNSNTIKVDFDDENDIFININDNNSFNLF